MIYLELFLCYLKIGFFGFGGGYSMLSLLHHEVVVNHQWISAAALNDIIAISQMTPGPIAINSATYIGYTIAGFWGSIIATTAVCLPSLTIMVLITRFFLRLKNSNYMDCIMVAMRPSVIGMIAAASMLLIFPDDKQGASMIDAWSWLLFAAAFAASLRKVNPIKLIILSAFAGIAIYYIPEVIAAPSAPQAQNAESESESQSASEPTTLWRGYDITDSEVIDSPEFEQEWVNYLFLLLNQPLATATQQISTTFEKTAPSPEATHSLLTLSEKYLYNPSSPMRNDALFIPVLEYVIDSPNIDPQLKVRPEALLKIASMNQVGEVANNIKINGSQMLHEVATPYTLLYFHDEECHDCQRVSEIIDSSTTLQELEEESILAIVRVCATDNEQADELYDLKAVPTLYLLDSEKRVLLKDSTIEVIINSLINNNTH